MKPLFKTSQAILFLLLLPAFATLSCKKNTDDPKRCEFVHLDEAANFVKQPIKDDRLMSLDGITDPLTYISWRNAEAKTISFITPLTGTDKKLYYLGTVPANEAPPRALSFVKGHLIRWDKLPEQRTVPIAKALLQTKNIKIDPSTTYIIDATGKPDGC